MNDTVSTEKGARVIFPPPLVFLSSILLGVMCRYIVAPARLPVDSTIRIVAGLLVILTGVGLIVWAHVFFARTGQNPIPWKPTPELIFQGPYRFTRNPMYLGMTLVVVGFGLAFGSRCSRCQDSSSCMLWRCCPKSGTCPRSSGKATSSIWHRLDGISETVQTAQRGSS
jgi:protein-S-isoprenylcysteine O-methyltransferase Ste14